LSIIFSIEFNYYFEKPGKSIPKSTALAKLAILYNVSSDYLIGLTQEEKTRPTKQRLQELISIIKEDEYTLNGQVVISADREKLTKIIEALYGSAKDKHK